MIAVKAREEKRLDTKTRHLLYVLVLIAATTTITIPQLRSPISNVSALEASQSVQVYWDADCTRPVYSINWGTLSPGKSKTITIYIKNVENTSILFSLTTIDYAPTSSLNYLKFTWKSNSKVIQTNQTAQVRQTLTVSPSTKDISNFSFNIIIKTQPYTPIPGDLNKDGTINLYDSILFASAYPSKPNDARWNPDADLNKDGAVDLFDGIMFANLLRL